MFQLRSLHPTNEVIYFCESCHTEYAPNGRPSHFCPECSVERGATRQITQSLYQYERRLRKEAIFQMKQEGRAWSRKDGPSLEFLKPDLREFIQMWNG